MKPAFQYRTVEDYSKTQHPLLRRVPRPHSFVVSFIEKYGQYRHLQYLDNPRPAKKTYSQRLQSSAFNKAADVVSEEQCMWKQLKLEAKYKEVEDNNKHTVRANQTGSVS